VGVKNVCEFVAIACTKVISKLDLMIVSSNYLHLGPSYCTHYLAQSMTFIFSCLFISCTKFGWITCQTNTPLCSKPEVWTAKANR